MRFAIEREQAVAQLVAAMPKPKAHEKDDREHKARKMLRHAAKQPKPVPCTTIGEGDKERPLTYSGGYGRATRRANGQRPQRNRLRGQLPPHPLAVINTAHRIERDGEFDRIARARRVLATERGFASVRAMMKADAAQ